MNVISPFQIFSHAIVACKLFFLITGKSPTSDSPCKCHYSGSLIDGTEFDSSYKRGQPLTLAPNQVIKGWTEAMQLMKEGGKWELYIPSELGYGDRGAGGVIPGQGKWVWLVLVVCFVRWPKAVV